MEKHEENTPYNIPVGVIETIPVGHEKLNEKYSEMYAQGFFTCR
jgi:hypothetical protein